MPPPEMTIEEAERVFEAELEVFRTEVEAVLQFLYAYLGLHVILGADPDALRRVNASPLLWKTIDGALHGSAFIALGRIFDQDSEHNLDRLLGLAQRHLGIFAKDRLGERKRRGSDNADTWLPAYLETAHVATVDDLREAKRQVSDRRQVFERIYRPIRNKIFAHKALVDASEVNALYEQTNIDELAGIVTFLHQLHQVLWQLFFNGNAPDWTYTVVDVAELIGANASERQRRSLQARILLETRDVLRSLTPERTIHADRTLAAEAPVSPSG